MKITRKQVEVLLRTAVNRRGRDTVVQKCSYMTADGAPNCIVGEVIADISGKAPKEIFGGRNEESFNINTSNFRAIRNTVEARTGLEFTPAAVDLLVEAQHRQDSKIAWGRVLDAVLPKV